MLLVLQMKRKTIDSALEVAIKRRGRRETRTKVAHTGSDGRLRELGAGANARSVGSRSRTRATQCPLPRADLPVYQVASTGAY